MQHIPQQIHQLQEEISVCPITGQLLEGRLTGNIQPNDPKNMAERDIYEFSGFSNYKNLLHLATTPTYLQDVVGQILIIQKTNPYYPEINTDATIGLRLNRSTMVKLILYDKQAADFSILQSKKNMKFKVVIITSIIPKLFQGT
ncbi:hypothetical protein Bca52824_052979 [Brassica carinata]|uniref:Uncharacterized protein n=1 Tax=Brassica carinata TaxID=52824 RepID=A0A8X7UKG8_BRACI|nr:hypothetical protein Bca52824_052979 [Brassica carinata]